MRDAEGYSAIHARQAWEHRRAPQQAPLHRLGELTDIEASTTRYALAVAPTSRVELWLMTIKTPPRGCLAGARVLGHGRADLVRRRERGTFPHANPSPQAGAMGGWPPCSVASRLLIVTGMQDGIR